MTLEQYKTIADQTIPTSKETYFTNLITAATKACNDYIGVESGTISEFFNGGVRKFTLSHATVSSVSSVKVDGTALESTAWRYDARTQTVTVMDGTSKGVENVEIVLSCSFTEDACVQQAIVMTVKALIKGLNRAGVNSLSLPEGGSETYDNQIPPMNAKYLLDSYRKGQVL